MDLCLVLIGALVLGQGETRAAELSTEQLQGIMRTLESPSTWTRRSALKALAEHGPAARAAVPALEEMAPTGEEYRLWMEARRRIGPGPDAFPYHLEREQVASDREEYFRYRYDLIIEETGQRIALAHRYVSTANEGLMWSLGFFDKTLLLRWLEPKRLLHVYWETIPQGSGIHTAQCNVILANEEGSWREVYRDWRHRYCKSGMPNETSTDVTLDWIAEREELHVRHETRVHEGGSTYLGPLSVPDKRREDYSQYYRGARFVTEWRGRLSENNFAFEPGIQRLILDSDSAMDREPPVTVAEVSEFLEESAHEAVERSATEHLQFLLGRNTGLAAEGAAPETMAIADPVPPLHGEHTELYRSCEERP